MTLKSLSSLNGIFAAACLLFVVSGCVKDHVKKTETYTYTITTPVYKTRAEVQASLNGSSSEPISTAGKLYIKDQFIYLNEVNKGIHIIDNSNPSHPTQVAFLNIPGNLDIAVKGNILYADTYTDLLAIDISHPKNVAITHSIPNFFQNRVYFNMLNVDSDMVIVGLITKDTIVTVDTYYPDCINCSYALANSPSQGSIPKSNSGSGTAGSMASMVLMNDHLYALQEAHSLGIVDISSPATPHFDTTFFAGFDLQTVYPFEDKLFLGSMSGMFMYDMTNPTAPVKLGEFSHGRACDPVVTDGTYAYVTLHAGTSCGGASNELNVIDIKDLMNPTLVKAYELTKPTGLCKDGNLLFVCDDDSGVRLYDATNADNLTQLHKIDIKGSYDIIAGNNHAMVVTTDGLYQYDYSDVSNIRKLSFYSLKN
ncbi:MAG: hypothetical protein QM802_11060 [Agriterribacter sp.]